VERWRAALRLLGAEAEAFAWRYSAFELDPNVPPEGVDRLAYLSGRYDPATVQAMGERLALIAASEGLQMADPATLAVRPSTFAAHRLMTAALEAGAVAQQALGDALFAAYWGRGEDIGEHGVLAAAANEAGMDAGAAAELLAGDAFAAEVRAQEREAARLGIHAVPTFVFDDRFSVSGAQDPAVLAQAARQALNSGFGER
jgi:predicted DsbA family dithiol-disulfide isomerase